MNILITGVAGFIGSHLCRELLFRNNFVVGIDNFDPSYEKENKLLNIKDIIDNPNFVFHELDICDDLSVLFKYQIAIVIHLAAKVGVSNSVHAADSYLSVNINGTLNVLTFMRNANCSKIVFASSSSVYGNSKLNLLTEDHPANQPCSPYAMSKEACELLLYSYHHLYKIDSICLRLFSVYGPNQRPDLVISKFSSQIKKNFPVTVYGEGDSSRDYTYITDIVDGIIHAVEFLKKRKRIYEIINIGSNSPVNILELIDKLYQLFQLPPQIIYVDPKKEDMLMTNADISKAERILKFRPKVNFDDGLRQFYEWFISNDNE